MNKKSMIYGFVSLFVSSAIAAGAVTHSNKAEAEEPIIQPNPAGTTSVDSPKAGMTTPVDQVFIELMIPHHQMAVVQAELAMERAERPEIKKLAASFTKDRPREIQQMQAWYKEWYATEVPTASAADVGMEHEMRMRDRRGSDDSGRMDDKRGRGSDDAMLMMATSLEALKEAPNFERAYMLRMIPYNEMAVMMAKMVVNTAEHPEIRELAQKIIRDRTAEIQQMREWYQDWYL